MTEPDRDPDRGPVLLDLDTARVEPARPEAAAPVPEAAEAPPPAMERAIRLAAAREVGRGGLARWFWALLGSVVAFAASIMAVEWVSGLLGRHPVLGAVAGLLLAALVAVTLAIAAREVLAIRRLARIDAVQRQAAGALARADLSEARGAAGRLLALYDARPEMRGAADRLRARLPEVLDADAVLRLAEGELMAPLDARAEREVSLAARQVAAVTAVVPLPLADVATALAANLRMIRRVAEIYGGRSGTVESLRLVRTVMTHLVATGAVAVGDDLIGGVAGGTVLSRLSRRFGEGVINGALTARVGVAAIEVCRPLPFLGRERPGLAGLVAGSLKGLFGKE